ncbi:MAG: hypothetical protein J7623_28705 [Chitinophaga sp.]|uniref:hypothetical protein n=1 Tax=Chitinophaga sp. TaxID=1869181 RepID=UPI001B16AE2B|nr:hypothetical protein [Chitinophaga sp.]MBO9732658.1 hypothetical protein [Chitinophaga sp.]
MQTRKLLLWSVFIAVFFIGNANAQSPKKELLSTAKGSSYLNLGVGLGSYGLVGTGGIPIVASYEYGVAKNISAGIGIGYVKRKFTSEDKYTYLMFTARGSYHFNELMKLSNPKLDIYAGAGLVYRRYTYKYTELFPGSEGEAAYTKDYTTSGGNVDAEIHAGARYLFTNHIGAFAELGYGISPLQLGLTLVF